MIVVSLVVLLVLLFASLPVAAAMGYIGLFLDYTYSFMPLHRATGDMAWGTSADILLVAVPMYVMLGEILLRSGMADRMYTAISHWLNWVPGSLMHANIGASMAFAATAGSSVATAATVSTVSIPLIKKYGFNERLFLGSLASGGTLGILIPPSINLIVYGYLTETSVPTLYLAGFVPGIVLGILFMITILLACLYRPAWGGARVQSSWKERIEGLPHLLPPLLIFLVVIGSIYAGFATPTESASVGVTASLILAAWNRKLNFTMLRAAITGTMRTTGMIMLILIASWFLNFVLTTIGITGMLNNFLSAQGFSPFGTLMLIIGFYLVLGCFMETMPLMVITVPTITPVIVKAGYDPIWFGILIILLIETAMITPPVGNNLYVVQGIRGRGSINDVIIGIVPFCFALLAMIALIVAFPQIALWLPQALK